MRNSKAVNEWVYAGLHGARESAEQDEIPQLSRTRRENRLYGQYPLYDANYKFAKM